VCWCSGLVLWCGAAVMMTLVDAADFCLSDDDCDRHTGSLSAAAAARRRTCVRLYDGCLVGQCMCHSRYPSIIDSQGRCVDSKSYHLIIAVPSIISYFLLPLPSFPLTTFSLHSYSFTPSSPFLTPSTRILPNKSSQVVEQWRSVSCIPTVLNQRINASYIDSCTETPRPDYSTISRDFTNNQLNIIIIVQYARL